MPLTLEIVTPEAKVYTDTIDSVVVPTVEGEIGVLPGHIPLLAQVADGELRVTKGGATSWLAVGGGFAQIEGDRVRVLAEHAITEEKIDEHVVEAAMKRAQDELKAAKDMDPQQYEHLQSLVRYAGVQLAVKRRRR
ncbi:ATP synthase F1 subunit epsilon [Opitutus sp. GAS368]|jgi:F-type H+-transporting ATPase subunit epsilon|uniref:ATP synthase F1 subunit epsilon n=1 Tax=Opitutus sp. GAS368 TaxID=1882749 RepID=UPI00087934FB|nr:ATP synthase F1 subunit epsilon [Opitutus sp. GAS368]SDR95194.1 F-type H+-transporting ATPase subunit epsilon [Opitutus sp. GAS368]